MKLIDILRVTDDLSDIVVWSREDNIDPVFQGSIMDVPWSITERKLVKDLEDGDCSISIRLSEDHNNAIMVVSVE